VTPRLHTRAQDRKHARILPREFLRRNRGHSGRSRFGDVAAVEKRFGLRITPHIYSTVSDIDVFADSVEKELKTA